MLLHEYESPLIDGEGGPALAHIDAYRITSDADAETIALDEILESCITAIEWPERLGDLLPARRIDIRLDHEGDDQRRITITAPPDLADRLAPIPRD